MGRDRSYEPLVSTDTRKTGDFEPSRVNDLTLMRADVVNDVGRTNVGRTNVGRNPSNIWICLFSLFLDSKQLGKPENRLFL